MRSNVLATIQWPSSMTCHTGSTTEQELYSTAGKGGRDKRWKHNNSVLFHCICRVPSIVCPVLCLLSPQFNLPPLKFFSLLFIPFTFSCCIYSCAHRTLQTLYNHPNYRLHAKAQSKDTCLIATKFSWHTKYKN